MSPEEHQSRIGSGRRRRKPDPQYVRPDQLGHLLAQKRSAEGLSLDQVSRLTGVSAATLSRWERKNTEGDPHKLTAVARWLGVQLDPKMVPIPLPLADPIPHPEGAGTVELVEAHLRADRNLDSRTASALAAMFRAAYEQFAGGDEKPQGEKNG